MFLFYVTRRLSFPLSGDSLLKCMDSIGYFSNVAGFLKTIDIIIALPTRIYWSRAYNMPFDIVCTGDIFQLYVVACDKDGVCAVYFVDQAMTFKRVPGPIRTSREVMVPLPFLISGRNV